MELDKNIQQRILSKAGQMEQESVKLLQELVRIPSVTHPPGGDEGPVQQRIAQQMRGMGLSVDVFEPTEVDGIQEHPAWWPGLDYQDRPNVVGSLKGAGGGRDLILNGHCDVVHEGDRSFWHGDPFDGRVENGRLYGRGSVDMKGGIAAMTMALSCIQQSGITLCGDVILESVVNEELGGYNGTLACIVRGYQADAAIVTEPSDLKVETQTKGGQAFTITVPGLGAHQSFWWEGVSALDNAIKIKRAIEEYEQVRCHKNRNNPLYADPIVYPTPAITDCVYSLTAGSPAIMGVPQEATLEMWIDVLPGEDLDEVVREFEETIQKAASLDWFMKEHPPVIRRADMRPIYPSSMPENHPLVGCVSGCYTAVAGRPPIVCGFEAACDAMMFNLYSDTPAMVFGAGQLGLAHRPDEYMDLQQYLDSIKILALTIADYCGVKLQ